MPMFFVDEDPDEVSEVRADYLHGAGPWSLVELLEHNPKKVQLELVVRDDMGAHEHLSGRASCCPTKGYADYSKGRMERCSPSPCAVGR